MKSLITTTHRNFNSKNPTTNLKNILSEKLDNTNTKEVLKSMGYNSIKKGLATLEKFLEYPDSYTWLVSGHYDFKYTAKEFLEKLSSVLEVDNQLYKDEMNNYIRIKNEHNKIKGSYIYVNTNFRRTTQPIFVLAFMEGRRLLTPAKKSLMFKTKAHILKSISKMVRKHYLANEGKLLIWGKIDNYVYHHFDGKKYVFNHDGLLLEDTTEIFESRAILSLK